MDFRTNAVRVVPLFAFSAPWVARAEIVGQVASLFNIFVGLMLTAAILVYGIGFVMWVTRLGTWPTYRTEAIKVLEWSVAILFVLVALLMVVQFFRDHPTASTYVIAGLILLFLAWGVVTIMRSSSEKKEDGEEH